MVAKQESRYQILFSGARCTVHGARPGRQATVFRRTRPPKQQLPADTPVHRNVVKLRAKPFKHQPGGIAPETMVPSSPPSLLKS
jgi:hypothetical protein